VDSGIRDQIGLEFSDIDVQGSIESQRGGQRGDDLSDQSVQVGISGSFDVQISSADIVNGFVIQHNTDVGVFQQGMGGQDGVIRFNDGGRDLGRGIDGESQFGFFTVIDGQSFQQERSQSRSGTSSDSVEDHESLQTSTVISQFSDSVQAQVDDFFTDGIMSSGEVVSGIFFSGDQLFGMEQLSVGSGSDFVNNGGFQIQEDGSGDVFTSSGLREESVEGIISSSDSFIGRHLSVRLNSVFKTEQFPAGITDLNTTLTNMYRNNFSHYNSLTFV
jgi:hypothetical protein